MFNFRFRTEFPDFESHSDQRFKIVTNDVLPCLAHARSHCISDAVLQLSGVNSSKDIFQSHIFAGLTFKAIVEIDTGSNG
jgi:hypothetical protein